MQVVSIDVRFSTVIRIMPGKSESELKRCNTRTEAITFPVYEVPKVHSETEIHL